MATDMPPVPRPPLNLPSLVRAAFGRAKASGDLTYYPTQVAVLELNSIPFQLRYSPALAAKPRAPAKPAGGDDGNGKKKPFNPFEKPLPAMTVCPLDPPTHTLVLNKFAVVPEHFILITRDVKPQTHVLEPDDLAAAYACVEAYRNAPPSSSSSSPPPTGGAAEEEDNRELFVFFNSGPHSGASQPHRHLQLLPVARMRDGLADAADATGSGARPAWDVLAKRVLQRPGEAPPPPPPLPFAVLAEPIAPGITAAELHRRYVGLYRRAVRLARPETAAAGGEEVPAEGEARISYNLAMTGTVLALCPRTAEGGVIRTAAAAPGGDEAAAAGFVALNGTVLAGTALVKSQAEWDALRGQPEQLLDVLKSIGVPPPDEPAVVTGNL